MSIWSDAVDDLMASERGAEGIYRAGGAGVGTAVRAVIGRLADSAEIGGRRSTTRTTRIDVRIADLLSPAIRDTIEIDGVLWRVAEPPEPDEMGLVWMLACHRVES